MMRCESIIHQHLTSQPTHRHHPQAPEPPKRLMPRLASPNRSHRPYPPYSFPPPTSRKDTLPDENPTIGLLLCKSAKKTIVELTLPKDANIHAKAYQLYLPSKDLLKQKLDEWSAAAKR